MPGKSVNRRSIMATFLSLMALRTSSAFAQSRNIGSSHVRQRSLAAILQLPSEAVSSTSPSGASSRLASPAGRTICEHDPTISEAECVDVRSALRFDPTDA